MNNLFAKEIIYDKAHSPYYLDSTLTIAENDTLIIYEGTTIIIDTAVDIIVYGNMFIKGTASAPVKIFPKVDSIGWGQIRLLKKGSYCKFEHAEIVDGVLYASYVNLVCRNIHFVNRQNLPLNYNILRAIWTTVDLQNCTVEGSGSGEGFLLMDMRNVIVRQCIFRNIPDAIECKRLKNSTITNNLFIDTPDDAIDLNNCTDIIIDSNIIIHAHNRGLEIGSENFGPSENIVVRRNLIVGCEEGITFKEGSSGIITNNTLYENKYGIVCKEIVAGSGGSNISIENTIISQSKLGTIDVDSLSEVLVSYSLSDKELMDGIGNIFADPLFVCPIDTLFKIKASSPCVDAGNPNALPDPDGTPVDVGAFYYNPNDTSYSSSCDDSDIQTVKIYPNPFSSFLYIEYRLRQPANVKIELFTIDGKKVKVILDEAQVSGNHKIGVAINGYEIIEDSYYVCLVSIDNAFQGFKVLRIH